MTAFPNDDSVQNVIGSANADMFTVVSGTSGAGDDTFDGLGGADVAYGGIGIDRLSGDGGNDTLFGGFDRDLLYGGSGDDNLFGNGGDDLSYGGDGSDLLVTEDGLFIFLQSAGGNDILNGGSGYDKLDLFGITVGLTIDLALPTATVNAGAFGRLQTSSRS